MSSRVAGALAFVLFCAVAATVQSLVAPSIPWLASFAADAALVGAMGVVFVLGVKALDGRWPWQ